MAECRAVIASVDAALAEKTAEPDAARAAQVLLGVYRTDAVANPAIYANTVAVLLSRYPGRVVRKVVDPVDGLPGKLKFLPSIAEIKAALDIERRKLANRGYKARWLIQKHEEAAREKLAGALPEEERERRRIRVEEILREAGWTAKHPAEADDGA